ncbi:hypothetical protein RvY_04595 [Ramazzottius varieornatus]|uniref:G-protein coupled receptors family 1 profile domain-containing protein n=1 Tax=Ramazzottius varieornatus TaxID=947166 RepID=A0A1D1US62_RAMVA|nr:hypothetical protein RvY_04595 [Ramazzottius varieornatus]
MIILDVGVNQTREEMLAEFVNGTEPPMLYLERAENYPLMVITTLLLSLSAIIGTLGNLLIIGAICMVRSLRTTGNIFVLNLALADVVVTLLIDPFNAVGAAAGRHVLMHNFTLCNFVASVCAPACLSSMWNMCAISINRYFFICKSPLYPRIFTVRNSILCCLLIWVMSHLFHLPNHTGWGMDRFNHDYYLCTFDIVVHSYAIFYIMMGVIIPLIGVLFGYTSIFIKVRGVRSKLRQHRMKQLVQPASGPTDRGSKLVPTQSTSMNENSASEIQEARTALAGRRTRRPPKADFKSEDVKLAKTLFAAFLVFFLCWLPFALFVLAHQPKEIPGWMYVLAIIMAHGNSAVNPILYGLTNENFRNGYRMVLGMRGNSVNDAKGRTVSRSDKRTPADHGSMPLPSTTNPRRPSRAANPTPAIDETQLSSRNFVRLSKTQSYFP